jgi:hypothetical protein
MAIDNKVANPWHLEIANGGSFNITFNLNDRSWGSASISTIVMDNVFRLVSYVMALGG